MRTDRFVVGRGMIVVLVFALLASGMILSGGSIGMAGEFKDPYNGGTRLPSDGGEPGQAYTALVNASYKKDYKQICTIMSAPAEVAACIQQKQALDGFIAMFTQPKSHVVRGGFMKGDEATLDVAYMFANAPQSTGYVIMKRSGGKWVFFQTGGCGSGSVSAGASGQAELGK